MKTESDFRNDCVSHAGARGLLQIMPVVWKDIKEKYDLPWDYSTEVFDPKKNIEVGCAYLAWLRYDFLPRNFAAYEKDPAAPKVLVRDKDRGVPDREGPRVIAKSDNYTPHETVQVASANAGTQKQLTETTPAKSRKTEQAATKSTDKTAKRPAVEISDARPGQSRKSTAGGKTRVTIKASGKAVALTVNKSGKVSTREKSSASDSDRASLSRREAIARADSKRSSGRSEQGS